RPPAERNKHVAQSRPWHDADGPARFQSFCATRQKSTHARTFSMPKFRADDLLHLATAVFARAGAPPDVATTVAEHLVTSSLVGHDSHGVLRIAQYVEMIDSGMIKPAGRPQVVERFVAGAIIDGHSGFGQVIAGEAMRLAIEIARMSGIAAVTVH